MSKTKGKSITGLVKALVWNVMEISDTINERTKVQQTRKVCDESIIKNTMRRLSLAEMLSRI
jgi:hypothetical protein